ncbi:MAG: putative peptidase [Cyclobacteriaceae bacterium]|jgi:predicted peptidase
MSDKKVKAKSEMVFDQFISSETNTDLIKMESVRQYHRAATEKIKALNDFEDKAKVIHALDYSYQYIARCQATFVTMQSQITELQLSEEKANSEKINLEARRDELEKLIKDLKKWMK